MLLKVKVELMEQMDEVVAVEAKVLIQAKVEMVVMELLFCADLLQ